MRVLLQRVIQASVTVDNQKIAEIGKGLLLLVGICHNDNESVLAKMAQKCVNLRIFEDNFGKMNLCALETNAEILVVSQFTLYADTRKGRRPSFSEAALPEQAEPLIQQFQDLLQSLGITTVVTGRFGAHMHVALINDGPVTMLLEQ